MASLKSSIDSASYPSPPALSDHAVPKKPKMKKQPPQKGIDEFWDKFTTKYPGKPFTILPDNFYAKRAAAHAPRGSVPGQSVVASYDEAVAACKAKVAKISKECRRINQKYRDPHFDIESDWRRSKWFSAVPPDCLTSLDEESNSLQPQSVKRVEDIFEHPQFFIEGATASDVRQGRDGDCWFMSALCTLSNKKGLIQNICVARDEQVGVYGFVFHRDGEWISEVIDDKLYLLKEDFDESSTTRYAYLELGNRKNPEEEYLKAMQTGSRALYFAQCSDQNETWVPLLEKAYAKAHGDYSAIEGGFVGEGIEDLTGGVTSEIFSTDILDKEKFWKEDLMKVNQDFLFGCAQMGGIYGERKGIQERHAYSIMEAREIDGIRLLKLRNPWGNTEWTGPWSDGSEEWTAEWLQKLDHKFGDDGVFWISYKDLLKNYQHFDRTRLFGLEWTVTQQWTSVNVPWSVDYLDTKFKVKLTKASPVVLVLSQLDDRYFRGLEGQYEFTLQFRLHKDDEPDYIIRSNRTYYMTRSTSAELDLEAGDYTILLKVTAVKRDRETPEEVIRKNCLKRREKLLTIGLSYDLAHAKGQFPELEKEEKEIERRERREKKKMEMKKAHESRRRQRQKAKLRQKKKAEKIASKKRTDTPPETNLDQRLEEFRIQGEEQMQSLVEIIAEDDTSTAPPRYTHRRSVSKSSNRSERQAEANTVSATGGGFGGRGGGNLPGGRGGYNAARDGYNSTAPPEGLYGRGGYNAMPGEKEGLSGRGGYNAGRDGYNNASTDKDKDKDALRGRGGYNETGGDASRPPSRAASPAPHARTPRASSPLPPVRRATLSPGLPDIKIQNYGTSAASIASSARLDDIDSDDLTWDSDLFGPDSNDEWEAGTSAPRPVYPLGPPVLPELEEETEDEFERDPWNAVCVLGLRMYSKDTEVSISVDRPKAGVSDEEGKALDVDDSAKDASREEVLSPVEPEEFDYAALGFEADDEREADADDEREEVGKRPRGNGRELNGLAIESA